MRQFKKGFSIIVSVVLIVSLLSVFPVKAAEDQWLTDVDQPENFAYSFAVVGDPQILARDNPDAYDKMYDWIVANKDSQRIKFVFSVGDITNDALPAQWAIAKRNFAKLNGVLPYNLVRGNHDGASFFKKMAEDLNYSSLIGGNHGGPIYGFTNTWQELKVGQIDYLIISLDYGARDNALEWAGEVIKAHPNHRVIIATHAYLFKDGTTLDLNDDCPPTKSGGYNNGDDFWNKLVSKYSNIHLVLSGHDPSERVVVAQTEGENGNLVTQMLIDPQGVDAEQGVTGMVTMLYFSEDGKNMTVRHYSTVHNKYFMAENQFDLVLADSSSDSTNTTDPTNKNEGGNSIVGGTQSQNNGKPQNNATVIIIVVAAVLAGTAAVVFILLRKKK